MLIVIAAPGVATAQTAQWREAVTLVGSNAGDAPSDLVADEADGGVQIVLGIGSDLVVRGRADASRAIGAPITISSGCSCAQTATVAMTPAGQAVVAWRVVAAGQAQANARIINPDGSLGPIEQVGSPVPWTSAGIDAAVDAAIDTTGRVAIVARNSDGTAVAWLRSSAGTWSAPTAFPGDSPTQLAVHASGAELLIALATKDGGVIARASGATSWNTTTTTPRIPQTVALAADGSVDLLWAAAWGSVGFDRVLTARLSAGGAWTPTVALGAGRRPQARTLVNGDLVAAWTDNANATITRRVRTATTWGPPLESPDMGTVQSIAIGRDGAIFAGASNNLSKMLQLWRGKQSWDPPVSITSDFAGVRVSGAGQAGGVAITFSSAIRLSEYSTKPIPVVAPRTTSVTVSGPSAVNLGSIAPLCVRPTRLADRVPVTVQRRSAGRWVTIVRRNVRLAGRGQCATVPVRMTRVGDLRLRVIAGTPARTLPPFTVKVRKPLRPRIPIGIGPRQIASGPAGIWTLEGMEGVTATRVRRLDARTGRAAKTWTISGDGGALAVGRDAAWVVSRPSWGWWQNGVWSSPGTTLHRIPRGTAGATSVRVPGHLWSVAADASDVWIGGSVVGTDRRAVRIDPANGQPTGTSATLPNDHVVNVVLTSSGLWMSQLIDPFRAGEPFWVGSLERATGQISQTPLAVPADTEMRILDESARWALVPHTRVIRTLSATPRTLYVSSKGFVVDDVARSVSKAWVLEVGLYGDEFRREQLVQIDLVSGIRTGRVINLGLVWNGDRQQFFNGLREMSSRSRLTIKDGVAWIMHPAEGTVLRIPLAG